MLTAWEFTPDNLFIKTKNIKIFKVFKFINYCCGILSHRTHSQNQII